MCGARSPDGGQVFVQLSRDVEPPAVDGAAKDGEYLVVQMTVASDVDVGVQIHLPVEI